ncbi:hypothetical protein [Parasediminibacterium sp. JCM 36343]|uniref:hypothetical protein n=1 Tax=Parasediminibacterium sp. JCM 36343 TaxID=3374279 RepID=UPI00397A6052
MFSTKNSAQILVFIAFEPFITKSIAKSGFNLGYTTLHETHRGKVSFAAHVTKTYLDKYPSLQLCLDASHWYCVAETMLDDQLEAVEKAILHASHLHSRVGFTEGPKVMDPRAPEWQSIVQTHLGWWTSLIKKN